MEGGWVLGKGEREREVEERGETDKPLRINPVNQHHEVTSRSPLFSNLGELRDLAFSGCKRGRRR